MVKHLFSKFGIFTILLVIILFWSYIFYFYTPEELVSKIGVTNGYIFLFLSAALGGVSTLTSSSFYTTVFTLVSGGLNPFLVGLVGGVGVTIGDCIFYYLGYKGKKVTSKKFNERIEHM